MGCVQKGVAGVRGKALAVDAVALGVSLGQACHSVAAAADDDDAPSANKGEHGHVDVAVRQTAPG